MQKLVDEGKQVGTYTAGNWMITRTGCLSMDNTLMEAADRMVHYDMPYLPVVSEERKPVGIVAFKEVMQALMHEEYRLPIMEIARKDGFYLVHADDSLVDINRLPYSCFFVVDDSFSLVGTLTTDEISKGLSAYSEELEEMRRAAEVLEVILESAYEGIAVVDGAGIVLHFNEAYSRFTGIKKCDAIGRYVKDVIDNTNLHRTVKTGMPERGQIQYIQGQPMVVHRIPIWKNGVVVGAIGMLIFEGVEELYRIYERFQDKGPKMLSEKPIVQQNVPAEDEITLSQIIGSSEAISKAKRLARKVAETDATVLLTGESGTGKEMFAKSIHNHSPYASGPFISVNCGAIPETLFESEFFGYEEGAFTGAKKGGSPGKFELARNGTLFLDEIGEIPLMMQTKLLRVLQEKEFERIGGSRKQKIKTRIIAATNRNLKEMVANGAFREDLYYRIQVIELSLPPLRERVEDIPLLLSELLKSVCQKYGRPLKEFTADALSIFMSYAWYGNVRELANMVEKLVILVEDDKIDTIHLPAYLKQCVLEPEQTLYRTHHGNMDKELIRKALQEAGGNKSKAAERLGIHRTTLYQKLKKYNIK